MYKRHLVLPKQTCFLFGARGTGKTTLLKKELSDSHFINLLDEAKYQAYLGDIEQFQREILAIRKDRRIVIDEVQRLPSLLNYVHDFIESDRRRFVLTGSSARKLKQKGVNLLAGRALIKNLYPLVPTELDKDFSLSRALSIGTLALVLASESPVETLRSYTLTYLSEEIKAEGLVKNLPGFSRFLSVAALFHGQLLNIASVARESGASRTTVSGFFSVLEDTLIGSFLPAYQSRPKVREVKHPKFYFFDPGVVRTIKRQSGEVDDDERGFLFEGYVHHCLKSYNAYLNLYDDLFFWSPLDAKTLEVDFLVKQGKELTAIEVKAKRKIRVEDIRGLRAIKDLKGVNRRYLVYMGSERQNLGDGVLAIPFIDFCKMLSGGKLAL